LSCVSQLADVVNLIPIIARADTLTPGELVITKSALADDLDANEVICYGNVIPAAVPGDPESLKMVEVFAQLAEKMPFAIISSVDVSRLSFPTLLVIRQRLSSLLLLLLLLLSLHSSSLHNCFFFISFPCQLDGRNSGETGFWAPILLGNSGCHEREFQ